MCTPCTERQSRSYMDVLPESINKVRSALAIKEGILERFREQGDDEAVRKVEPVVSELRHQLRDMENIEKSKGDLRPLDRFIGGINSLGSEMDPRVLQGKITTLEEALADAKSVEDEKWIRIRLIVARERLKAIDGEV